MLSPALIHRPSQAVRRAYSLAEGFEFSVEIDLDLLKCESGNQAALLGTVLRGISTSFVEFVTFDGRLMQIHPDGRALTRIIAAGLDQHVPEGI